jgi:hypothetical protein
MKVSRLIFALLIALSVAALPVAGVVGAVVKPAGMTDVTPMDDMDCCPHKANPCDKAIDGCASMATCALKCFTFASAGASPVAFQLHLASLNPAAAAKPFKPQSASPPFRPPRV